MLVSLLLETQSNGDPWWQRPPALRAMAYALFDRGDPELTRALHDMPGDRPFTLCARPTMEGARVRVTTLNEPLSRALIVAVASLGKGAPLHFGGASLTIADAILDSPPLAGATTYAELAAMPFQEQVSLRFVTPTSFSQGGDMHLPLPVPELLLKSWYRRWNLFGPPEQRIPEEVLISLPRRVGLAQACTETTTVELRPGKIVVFTGTITLEALRLHEWSVQEKTVFAALTAYSLYCGTGVRTTQGMGLTLRDEGGRERDKG